MAQKNRLNQFLLTKEAGVGGSTERISTRNSTSKGSWGRPQQREFQQEILQAKQVGVGPQQRERNKHCELYYELQ
ncbi:hypothetical protein HMPREF2916_11195 [Staphylococcus sp. HMSC068D05]|nr:hypothetical protein HMPREF2916_11195 [Staphylococcus sp. HMSC068D05]